MPLMVVLQHGAHAGEKCCLSARDDDVDENDDALVSIFRAVVV